MFKTCARSVADTDDALFFAGVASLLFILPVDVLSRARGGAIRPADAGDVFHYARASAIAFSRASAAVAASICAPPMALFQRFACKSMLSEPAMLAAMPMCFISPAL